MACTNKLDVVQFHPAYAYEDFMQGLRPVAREDGTLDYQLLAGRFLDFCYRARMRQGASVLIIDEINRANLSRVFGELMYLLEYRNESVQLAGGQPFSIPENVYLIGTMNTADRSIALVDHALRRRFAFLKLQPEYDVLRVHHKSTTLSPYVEKLIDVLKRVNQAINDPHYEVGITFFLQENTLEHLESIWRMEIEPYLEEYFVDQPATLRQWSWQEVRSDILGGA